MSEEPEAIAHFKILGRLGAGGMGIVYRATDGKLRRTVALKVLPESYTRDEERRARFLREARSAAAVTHANIATVYEVGEDGARIYIAMELVEGESLKKKLLGGALTPTEAVRIARETCKGLAKAHDKGIIHRDLKPDNVMLTPEGAPKILDFGLAKLGEGDAPASALESAETATQATEEGRVMGTPGYMSPEQATGRPVDARTDVFSLGVMLYEMLTGKRPFEGTSTMEVIIATTRDQPAPLPSAIAGARALQRVVDRCLAKAPSDRFTSAHELAGELDAWSHLDVSTVSAASGAGAIALPTGDAPPRWRKRLVFVALLVCALGGLAWLRKILPSGDAPAASTSGAPPSAPPRPPTTLVDLAPPKSAKPDAVAAYTAGMRGLRDGNWGAALGHFQESSAIDPDIGLTHLRIALTFAFLGGESSKVRDSYNRALQFREQLGERDAGLLVAVEPILQRSTWDRRECAKRLRALSERYPEDAELYVLRGWMLAGHPEEALEAGRRAAQLDDKYADAWQLEGNALEWLGRSEDAVAAYDRCIAVSAAAADCISWRAGADAVNGNCAQFEAEVHRWMDREPRGVRLLPIALYSRGAPRDTVLVALQKMWTSAPAEVRPTVRALGETTLAVAYGDFAAALEGGNDLLKLVVDSDDLLFHQAVLVPLVVSARESGARARVADLAYRFVSGLGVWRKGNTIAPLRDSATVFMLRVARDGGKLSADEFVARRAAWIRNAIEADDAPAGATWVSSYAAPAETEADAREALEALPPGTDLHHASSFPLADAHVGKVYLLAGKLDEAIPFLERATASCNAFADPAAHTRALYDLGQALEAKQNTAGACTQYARVVERWGKAKPRSVTAERAKARMGALACTK